MNYKEFVDKYDLKESAHIVRHPNNPILTKNDIPYPAHLIFNAGAVLYKGNYLMAFRDDYYYGNPSITAFHTDIGFAISSDGVHFKAFEKPFIRYEDVNDGENVRIYDPRLTVIEDDLYMNFALDTKHGIRGGIMKINDDLSSYDIISLSVPDNRNMVLFPEKINGYYVRLERPMPMYSRHWKEKFDLWISYSKDLKFWGESSLLLATEDISYANIKIGPAAPPIKTKYGYLVLFHSVIHDDELEKNGYENTWKKVYSIGAMFLDANNPSKIIALSKNPILIPKYSYEIEGGFRNNVVFPCAAILENNNVNIYYGAADTVTCLASINIDDLYNDCK